jgi:hypothetical protein
MPTEKPAKKIIDWEAIEKDYRIGTFSMRTLADKHQVNVSNISRRAKKEKWIQDKSEEVRQKTKATLLAQQHRNTPTKEDIETAVQTNIQVIRGHRKSIAEGLRISSSLFKQLETISDNREILEELIITLTEGDPTKEEKPDYKERMKLIKAISLPSHAGALRDLSTALKNLISLERQAFNLDEEDITDKDVFYAILNALPEQIRQQVTELVKAKLKNKS